MTPDKAFAAISESFLMDPTISRAKMIGAPTLKVGGKVFACLYKGKLVVKLSRARVDGLVASGRGEHFDPGMGRVMKEWVALDPAEEPQMRGLIEEARDFVSSVR